VVANKWVFIESRSLLRRMSRVSLRGLAQTILCISCNRARYKLVSLWI
jgi:hypothetical protein